MLQVDERAWRICHFVIIIAHITLIFVSFGVYIAMGSSEGLPYLPWISFGVGAFGAASNVMLFFYMLKLRKNSGDTTTSEERMIGRQEMVTDIGILLNLIFVCADFAMTGLDAANASDNTILAAPATVSALAGCAALATIIFDFKRLRQLKGRTSKSYQLQQV